MGCSWAVLGRSDGDERPQGAGIGHRLVRDGTGWGADPAFGAGGLWLASSAEGEVTSADLLALSPDGQLVVIGRGMQGGAATVFGAWLDPASGQVAAAAIPPRERSPRPPAFRPTQTGASSSAAPLAPRIKLPPNAPAEAVVLCLLPDGQPDPGFGTAGVARFRLNGGTYATAIKATDTGTLLVATALRWGIGRSGKFHPA